MTPAPIVRLLMMELLYSSTSNKCSAHLNRNLISENDTILELEIFPNPASNQINLIFSDELYLETTIISIYNSTGELVDKSIERLDGAVILKDLNKISSGIYIMVVQNGDKQFTKKFIKY